MRPIADDLYRISDAGELNLVGARCDDCSAARFPAGGACERCGSTSSQSELLPSRGELYTWTSQGFRPPSPPYLADDVDTFEPFLVGYVALGGELLVETRLVGCTTDTARIGASMRAVELPFGARDGEPIATYAFEPAEATS